MSHDHTYLLVAQCRPNVFAPDLRTGCDAGSGQCPGAVATLSNTMPINPIHVALLNNGRLLVVAGSEIANRHGPDAHRVRPSDPRMAPGHCCRIRDRTDYQSIFRVLGYVCNGMVLLKDGRPLIAGGTIQYDPFYGQSQVATFDPLANTFSNVQNMAHGRWYPTLLTLGDGRVMTFSGLSETGSTNSAVEFYPADSGWSSEYIAPWTPDLYPRLHLLPNGKVFYSGAQTTSKLFYPSTNTWNTSVAGTNYSGTRTYGTSVLLPLKPGNNYDPNVIIGRREPRYLHY